MSDHHRSGRGQGTSKPAAPDPGTNDGTDLARHLADIATVMLAPGRAATAAQRIVSFAVAAMDGCDEAGLCADSGLNPHTVPSALMARLDALQTRAGQGPRLDALGGLDSVYVPDLLDDQCWPLFSPEAARLGFRSALAYRLTLEDNTVGALQMYAHLPGAFNATERAQVGSSSPATPVSRSHSPRLRRPTRNASRTSTRPCRRGRSSARHKAS